MIEAIIWYVFLVDAVLANLFVWFYPKFFTKKKSFYRPFKKLFPATKGWCAIYIFYVAWVGWALWRLGVLPW